MDGSIRKTMFAKVSRGWGAIWKNAEKQSLLPRLGTARGPVGPALSLVMVVFFPLFPLWDSLCCFICDIYLSYSKALLIGKTI